LQALHHYNTFILISKILHLDLDKEYSRPTFKQNLLNLTDKNIIFKLRPNNKTAYRYFFNYDHHDCNLILNSNILQTILGITNNNLMIYSKYFKLKSTIFENNLQTFKSSAHTDIDYNKLKLQLTFIKQYTFNIIRNTIHIDPTEITKNFNLNLTTYRHNISQLTKYIIHNPNKKITNYNLSSSIILIPTTINRKNKNALHPQQFYKRYYMHLDSNHL
jgi:hypothetical protein